MRVGEDERECFEYPCFLMNYYFFGIDGRGRLTFTTVVNDVSHTVIPFTLKAAIHSGANATNQLQVIVKVVIYLT